MKLMNNILITFFLALGMSFNSYAIVSIDAPTSTKVKKQKTESVFTQLTTEELLTLSKNDIQEKVGRKLKLREKLGLKIIHGAVKRMGKKMAKAKAKPRAKDNLFSIIGISAGGAGLVGFFSGVGGIVLGAAGIVFGIIGLKKEEPKRILAILGIVFGGLAILISLIWLALVIASFF